jgi:hypothetical protein
VQGKAADANDWVWVHLEHNRTVRDTEALWRPSIDAVAAANPVLLAYDRPSPGGIGHTPSAVCTTSFAGTSRYDAREDHFHSGPMVAPGRPPVVALTAGGAQTPEVVAIDASRGDHFRIEALGDLVLSTPINGADGQRILVELLPSGIDCTLTIDDSLLVCEEVISPVVIGSGKRWFASMVHLGAAGSIVITTAAQA